MWKVVIGGAVISISNPYWWLWWATIGFNLLATNLPDLGTTAGVLAFFIGHELGDLSWYVLVSVLVFAIFTGSKIDSRISGPLEGININWRITTIQKLKTVAATPASK